MIIIKYHIYVFQIVEKWETLLDALNHRNEIAMISRQELQDLVGTEQKGTPFFKEIMNNKGVTYTVEVWRGFVIFNISITHP